MKSYIIRSSDRKRVAKFAKEQTEQEIGENYGLDCVMVKLDSELRKIGLVDENGEWNFEEEEE